MSMTKHLANRLLSSLRTLVLALFVLGVVVQPVAASVSEIHELSHDPVEFQTLAEHLDLPASDADEGGGSEPLHALHHFAHCCGQFTAIITAVFELPLPPATDRLLVVGKSQMPIYTRALAPYRPPITA
ncbi:MAG: DUF2946 family protein [Thermomonas sp.]